jgi:predicted nucleic acid-binding protein
MRTVADITIDTSAVLAVLVGEPERDSVVRLTRGRGLLAPGSVPWEVGNAFSAMFKRGRVSLDEALRGLRAFEGIPIRFAVPGIPRALELSHRLGIHAYDAYLLECAWRFRTPLLTLDSRLSDAAREVGIALMEE